MPPFEEPKNFLPAEAVVKELIPLTEPQKYLSWNDQPPFFSVVLAVIRADYVQINLEDLKFAMPF